MRYWWVACLALAVAQPAYAVPFAPAFPKVSSFGFSEFFNPVTQKEELSVLSFDNPRLFPTEFSNEGQGPLVFTIDLPPGYLNNTIPAGVDSLTALVVLTEPPNPKDDPDTRPGISDVLQVTFNRGLPQQNSFLVFHWFSDPIVPNLDLTKCDPRSVRQETGGFQTVSDIPFTNVNASGECFGMIPGTQLFPVSFLPDNVLVDVKSEISDAPQVSTAVLVGTGLLVVAVLRRRSLSRYHSH